jgi:beta-glucosidase-like glycosyl hydrolase
VASEGADLSRRLAAESVTLLKNEQGLLSLRRDIAKVAIIGQHADDVEAGFTTYTYPARLKMMQARATGDDIAMVGGRPRQWQVMRFVTFQRAISSYWLKSLFDGLVEEPV